MILLNERPIMRFANKLLEKVVREDKRPSPELVDKIEDAVKDSTFLAISAVAITGTAAAVCGIKDKIDNSRKALNKSINDVMDVALVFADESRKMITKDLYDTPLTEPPVLLILRGQSLKQGFMKLH